MNIALIGTGRIAQRFVSELKAVPSLQLCAVYNPRIDSAKSFVQTQGIQIELATDQLEEVWKSADAVYIATPHETHVSYVTEALQHGKHVLCEKPMSFSKQEAEGLFALAKAKGLVLMEAVKTAYCPGFQKLLSLVRSGIIGSVRDVEACFSRLGPSDTREVWDLSCGGSFTEFGTYTLLPIVKMLGTQEKSVSFWSSSTVSGVDGYTKAYFDFGNCTATAKTGLMVKSEGQLLIAGTNGYILVPSPWWLTRHFEVRFEDSSKKLVYDLPFEGAGLRYELAAFAERIEGKEEIEGLTPEESIWMAGQLEDFLGKRAQDSCGFVDKVAPNSQTLCISEPSTKEVQQSLGIWAHRGCSLRYPENTLESFAAAAQIHGLIGIELDVQMTLDKELVVIHDETLDRTTDGQGAVASFTKEELAKLRIKGSDCRIPSLAQVFDLLKPYCISTGLNINIELKNSEVRYEGMEERLLQLVQAYGLQNYVLYSSFLPESMGLIKKLCPDAQTAILGENAHDCYRWMQEQRADAIHPAANGLLLDPQELLDAPKVPVRIWGSAEPLYGQDKPLKMLDLERYRRLGVTDIFTNVPELYLV